MAFEVKIKKKWTLCGHIIVNISVILIIISDNSYLNYHWENLFWKIGRFSVPTLYNSNPVWILGSQRKLHVRAGRRRVPSGRRSAELLERDDRVRRRGRPPGQRGLRFAVVVSRLAGVVGFSQSNDLVPQSFCRVIFRQRFRHRHRWDFSPGQLFYNSAPRWTYVKKKK